VTYGSFVCTIQQEKAEPNQTRFTAGGDKINYPFKVTTPTAEMLVAKILFNSVISTPGARFMTMDISNFYLMTPLKLLEYTRIRLSEVPEEIISEYNLCDKVNTKGMIHIKVVPGMYRLPQAGLKRRNKHGYQQSKLVPGLLKHDTRLIQFALTVGDFTVKYIGQDHAIQKNLPLRKKAL
jgi:hypothetical protein